MKPIGLKGFAVGILLVIVFVASASAGSAQNEDLTLTQATAEGVSLNLTKETEPGIYLIRLSDPPLATYKGGIAGLAATSPQVTGARKLDVASPASRAYRQHLAYKQTQVISAIERRLAHSVEVVYRYYAGNNGIAAWLTPPEAAEVAGMPGVIFVQRDFERQLHTDAGPSWIGAQGIWDGTDTGGLPGTMGEGIVVGIIDTGINPLNPSFAEVGPVDGYVHVNPLGSGNFVPGSYCDTTDPSFCNDKLIGAWGYPFVNGGDPTDSDGHGSHTASTAARNFVTATVEAPTLTINPEISGVAPHGNIIAYAACCFISSLSAAIDQTITDGVDVINYSIGSTSPSDVWNDFDTVGFLSARTAGIFVATSAGNSGPGAETVGSPADAPWLTAVGASTHDREYANALDQHERGQHAAAR